VPPFRGPRGKFDPGTAAAHIGITSRSRRDGLAAGRPPGPARRFLRDGQLQLVGGGGLGLGLALLERLEPAAGQGGDGLELTRYGIARRRRLVETWRALVGHAVAVT